MAKKRRRVRKGWSNSSRSYDDPAYSNFRKEVRKRDESKCRYPGCGSKKTLQVHHIKKWSSHPSMRYDTTNGITLCKKCHTMIQGSEEVYEAFFYKILEWDAVQRINQRNKDEQE